MFGRLAGHAKVRAPRVLGAENRLNVHLLRNSFEYASKRDGAEVAKDLKPFTRPVEAAALDASRNSPANGGKREERYPVVIRFRENAWAEFVPFLRFDHQIRTIICTTNAIESINTRLRRALKTRGHFPFLQRCPDRR